MDLKGIKILDAFVQEILELLNGRQLEQILIVTPKYLRLTSTTLDKGPRENICFKVRLLEVYKVIGCEIPQTNSKGEKPFPSLHKNKTCTKGKSGRKMLLICYIK
jgi:hypothetical protein